MKYYTLEICGLKRKLPISHIGKKTRLANFSILGDVELVDKVAAEFVKILKPLKFDFLVGPEVKVVPLIHAVAKRLGHKRFIVCRKSIKPYMTSPVIVKPLPHFPKHIRPLVIDGEDAQLIKGKKVVILDDIVSTGVTMRMMKHLLKKIKTKVVKSLVILKQGEQFDEIDDLIYLQVLPIFKSNCKNSILTNI